ASSPLTSSGCHDSLTTTCPTGLAWPAAVYEACPVSSLAKREYSLRPCVPWSPLALTSIRDGIGPGAQAAGAQRALGSTRFSEPYDRAISSRRSWKRRSLATGRSPPLVGSLGLGSMQPVSPSSRAPARIVKQRTD